MSGKVEHVIVLMLENRSFDHMLGFLGHPNPAFEGLKGNETNPWLPGEPARVTSDATQFIDPGPDHSHPGVMMQLLGEGSHEKPYHVTNQGFALNFEQHALRERGVERQGAQILRCLPPGRLPVLRKLALEFAVCDHWFCSVPGETWPNRNFAHAATSDGEVEIVKRFYFNRTIFQLLSEANRQWGVYHNGFPQVMVFPWVWDLARRNRVRGHRSLFSAIRHDKLPHYSFVEPRHFPPFSQSQHPDNNRKDPKDFIRAERLVARIYNELLDNPEVWRKTLFVITYDEHGGYYDHLPPPQDPSFRDGMRNEASGFEFDLLGPRVPAVLVSPWILAGTLDQTVYDHSSIPATLRALFAPDAEPLTPRDAAANTFTHNLSLDVPRDPGEVRYFDEDFLESLLDEAEEVDSPGVLVAVDTVLQPSEMDGFQKSLVGLARDVEKTLRAEDRRKMSPGFDVWPEAGAPDADAFPGDVLAVDEMTPAVAAGDSPVAVATVDQVAVRVQQSAGSTSYLRTSSGESIQDPSRGEMESAVRAVRETADPEANAWLADQDERSVTLYGDGRVVFLDLERDVSLEAAGRSVAEVLHLFGMLQEGRIEVIERAMQG